MRLHAGLGHALGKFRGEATLLWNLKDRTVSIRREVDETKSIRLYCLKELDGRNTPTWKAYFMQGQTRSLYIVSIWEEEKTGG